MKPKLKAFINYDETPETRAVLLYEVIASSHKVVKGDRAVLETGRKLRPDLIASLVSKGAVIINKKTVVACGKDKVFNIPLTKSRTFSDHGVKKIRVTIYGETLIELMEKISAVKKNMAEYNIIPNICIWGQVGKLNTRETEEAINTYMPEFDKEVEKKRMKMELSTMRGDYKV